MSSNITVQQLANQLTDKFVGKQAGKDIMKPVVKSDSIELDKHCKKISKVKGEWPSFASLMSSVVQGYSDSWTPLGALQFRAKVLKNFRQKVNFPIKPNDIYNTWMNYLYEENLAPKDMPLVKFVIKEILEQVIDDIDNLSITGEYDQARLNEFGYSVDGIAQVITNGMSNTDNPYFKIPINAITDANILDEIYAYEKGIPKGFRKKVKKIFMSTDMKDMYELAYEEEYSKNIDYKSGDKLRTKYGKREIVAFDFLPDNIIFCTLDKNLWKLIDIFDDAPEITDVQAFDYIVKVFMEFAFGYDFGFNEIVYVADFSGTAVRGLDNAELNALIYPKETLTLSA